jgi:LmbE family N-acetylglucosaminyl deacetylase
VNVLVVAAHPDDEILGVGGTIARHVAAGDRVDVVICAEGLTSRGPTDSAEMEELRRCAANAAGMLGARAPRFLGFPDNRMDSLTLLDVVKPLEAFVAELDPAVVYTHNPSDRNVDHGVVFNAVATACRPMPNSHLRAIYCFETPSSTEWGEPDGFAPTHFVDISDTLEPKLAALKCYESEMRPFPHPRSYDGVRHLAHWRGASAGFAAAEAFAPWRTRWFGKGEPAT